MGDRDVSRPVGPKPTARVWIKWVKKVAGRRSSISAAEYDKKRPEGAPAARTLMRWAGKSWSGVCEDAGKQAANPAVLRWADEAKIAAIQAAARSLDPGELLTLRRYQAWRSEQPEPAAYPSSLAFGNANEWLGWCRRAEVTGGAKRRRYRHPDQRTLEHLIAAGDGSGRVGTTRYELYRSQHPDAPSRATIICRYQGTDGRGWEKAQAAAAALVAARSSSEPDIAGRASELVAPAEQISIPAETVAPRRRRRTTPPPAPKTIGIDHGQAVVTSGQAEGGTSRVLAAKASATSGPTRRYKSL
jgi:hypothetical protein